MKIRIKKKSSILSILIILFLVTASLSVYFLFFNKEKEEDDYDKLFKHCIEEDNNKKECKVFLKELRKEKGKVCMDIILPEIEVEKRDITVCFNSNIEWEDPYEEYPYEQYSMATPIVLTLEYTKRVVKSNPREIDIRLMEDEEAFSVLESHLNDPQISPIQFVWEQSYDFLSKGYLYDRDFIEDAGDFFLHLDLIGVEIISVEKEEEEIKMEISFRMDDSEIFYTFRTHDFGFHRLDELKQHSLDAQADFEYYLDLNRYYLVSFSLYDTEKNSYLIEIEDGLDERVYNYFSGDKDSNLHLTLQKMIAR